MTTQVEIKKEKLSRHLVHEEYLDIAEVPLVLFHPSRMLIMKALARFGNVEFRQFLHTIPNMTDGNLASHLRVLEGSKYIETRKEIVGRKLRTSYEITETGRNAFKQLEQALRAFLKDGDECHE